MLLMGSHGQVDSAKASLLQRLYRAFDNRFERVRHGYTLVLSSLLAHRRRFALGFLGFCLLSCLLYPFLGRDFFPNVDGGQIRLHMRMPTGTRIEETARAADEVERVIRSLIPASELETILDNLGVPNSGINLSYSNAGTIGTLDGEILMALKEGHRPTEELVSLLREQLPRRFRHRVLLPAGRHRHPDPQLRPARGHRRAVHRPQHGSQCAPGRRADQADPPDSGAVDAHVHQRLDGLAGPAHGSHAPAAVRPVGSNVGRTC
jgi:multidrug efflux pump subunit AcrB